MCAIQEQISYIHLLNDKCKKVIKIYKNCMCVEKNIYAECDDNEFFHLITYDMTQYQRCDQIADYE